MPYLRYYASVHTAVNPPSWDPRTVGPTKDPVGPPNPRIPNGIHTWGPGLVVLSLVLVVGYRDVTVAASEEEEEEEEG